MDARFWVELLSATGYGALSGVVPIFHVEALILAAIATGILGPVSMSIGLSVGHLFGKQALFLAVRHGRRLPVARDQRRKEPEEGSWRARWNSWVEHTSRKVEDPKWGYPLLFVSAATGFPPIYAVALFAGSTKINFWGFSAMVLVGFFVRCYVLALATLGVISL